MTKELRDRLIDFYLGFSVLYENRCDLGFRGPGTF